MVSRSAKAPDPCRSYPIEANLEYKIIRGHAKVMKTYQGRTVYLSSSEIVFKPEYPIPIGLRIKASMDWPVRLDNLIALRLHVHGEITRTDNGLCTVKIQGHEFRVSSQDRTSALALRAQDR